MIRNSLFFRVNRGGWFTGFLENSFKNNFLPKQEASSHKAMSPDEVAGKISLLVKRDFKDMDKKQIEIICSTLIAIAKYKVSSSTVLSEKEKGCIILSVRHVVMSRFDLTEIENIRAVDHIFNKGDYPIFARQATIFEHIGQGGESSVFRGSTESQDEGVAHQESPKVFYRPIYGWGLNVPMIKRVIEDHSGNVEKANLIKIDLGLECGKPVPHIFRNEGELAVARPIPSENIQKIIPFPGPKGTIEIQNPCFDASKVTEYKMEINEGLFQMLKKENCLVDTSKNQKQ